MVLLGVKGLTFFLRDFIFKKTLFEKLQYLKQEQGLTVLVSYFLLYSNRK